MGDIKAALAAIESLKPGEKPVYQHIADQFGVSRTTLSRRHRGVQASSTTQYDDARALSPHQEAELLEYIKKLTLNGLPPTRPMIRNFASPVAGRELSMRWVDRFYDRYNVHLILKTTTGIDRVRHEADSPAKYNEYFDLLYQKIQQYNVQPRNTYNMDEKGCMIGVIGRSKRVFSKAVYEITGRAKVIQDGNRDWVTTIACVCADGTSIPYAVIYSAKNGNIRDTWVNDMDPDKDVAFVASSETGWTNNELGLAWIRDVFDANTKQKARRSWRLLILDGHGSHVTMDFIDYCNQNRILLMVYPPHSTHTLQPLDVALFKPLSTAYSKLLDERISQSQGLLPIKKSDFFELWRSAYTSAFTTRNILTSFECTGIWPMDRSKIISRFYRTPTPPEASKAVSQVSPTDWHSVDRLLKQVVKDTGDEIVQRLTKSIHRAATETKLLRHENKGLRTSLLTQTKRKGNAKRLPLAEIQVRNDRATGGAEFWSPGKVKEAQAIKALKHQEAKEIKLEKARIAAEKAAQKVQQAEEKEERIKARKLAKEVREKEAAERAARVAENKRQREENNTQKAIYASQKGKRKASRASASSNKRKKVSGGGARGGGSSASASQPAPASPAKTTSRGRNVQLPARYM